MNPRQVLEETVPIVLSLGWRSEKSPDITWYPWSGVELGYEDEKDMEKNL